MKFCLNNNIVYQLLVFLLNNKLYKNYESRNYQPFRRVHPQATQSK
jgi:hypothetical protein